MSENPSVIDMISAVDYDSETGLLTWKFRNCMSKAWNSRHSGKLAFNSIHSEGYKNGKIGKYNLMAHRVAWAVYYGSWPEEEIDHVDRDRSNNRIDNLRQASPSKNQWNKGKYKNNSSGFKGVTWSKSKGSWMARCSKGRQSKFIGYFDTAKSAHDAYMEYAKSVHGEYVSA